MSPAPERHERNTLPTYSATLGVIVVGGVACAVVGGAIGVTLAALVRALQRALHHVAPPSLARLAALAQVLELPLSVASLVVAVLAYRAATRSSPRR